MRGVSHSDEHFGRAQVERLSCPPETALSQAAMCVWLVAPVNRKRAVQFVLPAARVLGHQAEALLLPHRTVLAVRAAISLFHLGARALGTVAVLVLSQAPQPAARVAQLTFPLAPAML